MSSRSLRQQMIRVLELDRKSAETIKPYVAAVAQLAKHYGRSPDQISIEEIRDFIHYLITVRKLSSSTCNQRMAGINFFYRRVLGQTDFDLKVPLKRSGRLPEPLSRSEISLLIDATRNLKHRALIMTAYGGGLRVDELVMLKPEHIHSDRMLIRVNQGKGRKDRYTLLSPKMLAELRNYWAAYRNRHCPKCQTQAKEAWRAARQLDLLPVPYFHQVFTLPHELNPWILASEENQRALLKLLFDSAAGTLLEFGQGELGGQVGLLQSPLRWSRQTARLSQPLHAPRGDLE